eukprot:SAG11_NODE_36454_length_261_cov_0.962963_1_plen_60_part_01
MGVPQRNNINPRSWERCAGALPGVPAGVLAPDSGSPPPLFPDMEGLPRQGDDAQRCADCD